MNDNLYGTVPGSVHNQLQREWQFQDAAERRLAAAHRVAEAIEAVLPLTWHETGNQSSFAKAQVNAILGLKLIAQK